MSELFWLFLAALVVTAGVLWPWVRVGGGRRIAGFAGGVLLVAVLAVGGYAGIGVGITHPRVPDMATMIDRLAAQVRQQPDQLDGWLRLARVYAMADRSSEAMAAYQQVLTRDPTHVDARSGLASEEMSTDDAATYMQGVQRFAALLKDHPEHPEALWMLGISAVQLGERQRAVELWQRLLQQLPAGTPAHTTVTQALQELVAGQSGQ
jgi:cytochrome c-type biogenesis protein CcmH/NrfG